MADFPTARDFSTVTISSYSKQALGFHSGLLGTTTETSGTYPAANTAFFIPFRIGVPTLILKVMWLNGATVSGNVDMGIYDSQANRVVSAGSTAQAGTTTFQSVDTTDVTLEPGLYYMAIAMDNTTGALRRGVASSGIAAACRAMGILSQASAFPLPATATFIGTTTAYIPLIAITTRTLI